MVSCMYLVSNGCILFMFLISICLVSSVLNMVVVFGICISRKLLVFGNIVVLGSVVIVCVRCVCFVCNLVVCVLSMLR